MKSKKKITRGLCKDKRVFTKTLKDEIALNVVKEGVKVTLKSKLKEDLDIDSLEAIEMLLDLEDKYNVEIDNTLMDFNKIKTNKIKATDKINTNHVFSCVVCKNNIRKLLNTLITCHVYSCN